MAGKEKIGEEGAALFEFVLCALVLLGTIGFLFEWTLMSFHQAALRYSAVKTARELSANVGSFRTIESLQLAAKNKAKSILQNSLGIDISNVNFDVRVEQIPDTTDYTLFIAIEKRNSCLFCIYMLNATTQIAMQNSIIGDKCFAN